jgi:oxygen-dependent protoporphyrinogen oxidase
MRVAVIGGGISGIATAFYLLQRQTEVDLYESAEQIGGRVGSELMHGRWVDFGGKNIGKHYYRFRDFVRANGNPEFEYFGFNTSQLINGRVIGISKEGSRRLNTLKIMSLCGINSVRKLYPHVRALLNDREQGVLGSSYFRQISERYDHLTLAEYLSGGCVRHVIRPVTIRMNGAEPDECYPGNFGSNLALALDSYEQLKDGMHELIDSFRKMNQSQRFRILEGYRVTSISNDPASPSTIVTYIHKEMQGTVHYDRVISALPAHRLATILDESLPSASTLLRQIRYFPVAIAIVKYRDEVFSRNRRAMVFDASQPLSNAGAYGVNDLNLVRFTFSGRISRSIISEDSAAGEVVTLGEKVSSPYFNIEDNSRETFTYKYLNEGLCAYAPRHHQLLEKIDRELAHISGLETAGDYRRGASIEACFRAAEESVNKVIGEVP